MKVTDDNPSHMRDVLRQNGGRRLELRRETKEVTQCLKEVILDASQAGMSESEIARLARVSRKTVRDWLGK